MNKLFFLFLFFASHSVVNAQNTEQEILYPILQLEKSQNNPKKLSPELEAAKIKLHRIWMDKIGFPSNDKEEKITHHPAYSLHYNEYHEQADWVMHVLSPEIGRTEFNRTIEFSEDTLIESGTACKEDYFHGDFDLGHLAPSADFKWSQKLLNESYLYSNISPQTPLFNRGAWKETEKLLRNYVLQTNRPLMILTGPILHDSLSKTGLKNKISVPEFFFKAALDFRDSSIRGIAFVLPHTNCIYPPLYYAISIDSLEKLIGYNLFPKLEDNKMESIIDLAYWQRKADNGNLLPMEEKHLPENAINTAQAKLYTGSRMKVCGTIVSEKYQETKNISFYEWDRKFPDRIFTLIYEHEDDLPAAAPLLIGKNVCIEGMIEPYLGIPSLTINALEKIEFIDLQINR